MNRPASAVLSLLILVLLAACGGAAQGDLHDEHDTAANVVERGAHGGRVLKSGDLQLEVSIFEDGVPPEFRLYAEADGRPIPPDQLQATIELRRITGTEGGVVDKHTFAAHANYLVSASQVYEPHSFDVSARVEYAGKVYEWRYESPEARVEIDRAAALTAKMVIAKSGPGTIADQLLLYGQIVPDAERVRQVRARFPGPVRSVMARVGDSVRSGQRLATIESNESLQTYSVTAPISGLVTARNVNVGENASAEALFEIADFSSVWAEVAVFPRDRGKVVIGQSVDVRAAEGELRGAGAIRFLSPTSRGSSSITARVMLDNRQGQWTPGQFVEAQVSVAKHAVPNVVPLTALQRVRDWDVVFVNEGNAYQAVPVTLGRRDSTHVEILDGLAPGAQIVTGNSYLVKADIEKSGASHDH
jgi:membrane fusion protein, heavy metal efflux system